MKRNLIIGYIMIFLLSIPTAIIHEIGHSVSMMYVASYPSIIHMSLICSCEPVGDLALLEPFQRFIIGMSGGIFGLLLAIPFFILIRRYIYPLTYLGVLMVSNEIFSIIVESITLSIFPNGNIIMIPMILLSSLIIASLYIIYVADMDMIDSYISG